MPALAVVLCISLLVCGIASLGYYQERAASGSPAAHFNPGGQTTAVVVATLAAAQRTVRVQAYSFTSAPIAKALVDAKQRGVDAVQVTNLHRFSITRYHW